MTSQKAYSTKAFQLTKSLLQSGYTKKARNVGSYLDLIGKAPQPTGLLQSFMLFEPISHIYSDLWRPVLARVAKGLVGPTMSGEYSIALQLLELGEGDTVLDLACGPGNFTTKFSGPVGPGGLVVGTDVSEPMLEKACSGQRRRKLKNIQYLRADAANLPFKDKSFDAVCCFGALYIFEDPYLVIDEIVRVLKPGGRIALLSSARSTLPVVSQIETAFGELVGITVFGVDELKQQLHDRDFRRVEQKVSGRIQFIGGRLPSR